MLHRMLSSVYCVEWKRNSEKTIISINVPDMFREPVSFATVAIRNCIQKGELNMTKSLHEYCIEQEKDTLLAQWDKEKNGSLTPHNVSFGSHKRVWWQCESGHRWEAPVYSRTSNNSGCPYCTGKKLPPLSITLVSEYPLLLKEWHPTLNTDVTPDSIAPGSLRKVWWRCSKGHEWLAQVKSRVRGTGCPYCSNRKIIIGENDLATTHPEIAAQWHPTLNGSLKPTMFTVNSHQKIWWQCEDGHVWKAVIYSRTCERKHGCPVCAGRVKDNSKRYHNVY